MGSLEDAKATRRLGLDVGFLCAGWPPDVGGVESHAQDLARALATRGHRVHVLCLDSSPGLEPFGTRSETLDGVEVRRMAYAYHDHGALADVVVNARAEDVIHAWMAETPCDVIHVHHLTGFGMGALRAIADVGSPAVMTLHDYWPLCPRGQMLRADGTLSDTPEPDACAACLASTWPHLMPSGTGRHAGPRGEEAADDRTAAELRTAFALEALALPHRLFTPSEAARAVYVRAGLDPGRIDVCANGVEVEGLAEEVRRRRAERPRSGDALRLGCLGTVLPSKGVLELAEAFVEAELEGVALEVHGNLPSYHGDGSYVERLQALGAEHEQVTVHGPYARGDLAAILAGLDGVAAPSRWEEVFGLTVREARAAGLPVLVSDAGARPEGTGGGRAGLVVPRDDRAAWVDALRRFATDGEARAAWAAAEVPLRTTRDMMLQLERGYAEAILAVTGLLPDLAHPIDGRIEGQDGADAAPAGGGLLRRLGRALGLGGR